MTWRVIPVAICFSIRRLASQLFPWAIPPVRLALSERNSGNFSERPRKRSQSVSWNSRREYGWDPPQTQKFKAFEASRAFPEFSPPQYGWGRLFISEVVPDWASQSWSWNSQQYWGYFWVPEILPSMSDSSCATQICTSYFGVHKVSPSLLFWKRVFSSRDVSMWIGTATNLLIQFTASRHRQKQITEFLIWRWNPIACVEIMRLSLQHFDSQHLIPENSAMFQGLPTLPSHLLSWTSSGSLLSPIFCTGVYANRRKSKGTPNQRTAKMLL